MAVSSGSRAARAAAGGPLSAAPGAAGHARPEAARAPDGPWAAGADAVLTVLANPQAKLGLIFLDAKRAAEQISSLLSPVPSTVPAFPG